TDAADGAAVRRHFVFAKKLLNVRTEPPTDSAVLPEGHDWVLAERFRQLVVRGAVQESDTVLVAPGFPWFLGSWLRGCVQGLTRVPAEKGHDQRRGSKRQHTVPLGRRCRV